MIWRKIKNIVEYIKRMRWYEIGALCIIVSLLVIQSFVGSFSKYRKAEPLYEKTENGEYTIDVGSKNDDIPMSTITFENIPDNSFIPQAKGTTLRINLVSMKGTLYIDGIAKKEFKILSKGKIGSIWETPGGTYEIDTKDDDYYSEKVGAWLPYSIHLFGNYFIHGIPHDKNGRPLPNSYPKGCIRINTEDARELFDLIDFDTKISIFSDSTLKPESISTDSVYVAPDGTSRPNVSAESYIVGDIDTGEIILQKNIDDSFPIASVTKLMTAVVSTEKLNQFEFAKVSSKAAKTYGKTFFKPGEEIPVSNLLFPLLLPSSNVAAEIIAEHKGRDTFISYMNSTAKELKMSNTHFDDPSGLSPDNTSSARDLFELTSYITKEKPFLWEITKRPSYSAQGHTWINVSKFTKDKNHIGSKLGFTDEAKQTNVGVWSLPLSELENRRIAIIVLRSNNRFMDTENILSYLKKRVIYTRTGKFKVAVDDGKNEVKLRFVGDIMLDRGVTYSVKKNLGGNFSRLFELLGSDYKDADIFFANLEGPISTLGEDKKNLYSFRMDPKVIPVLKQAGLDIVSFANNHVGDWGRVAFDDTRRLLTENQILYTGAGNTYKETLVPTIITKNNLKIGFIGFTDVGPEWLKAEENASGVLLANDPNRNTIIEEASKSVDILVVSFHWGVEYEKETEHQINLAHEAIDHGARIVVGHHPHIVQSVETYRGGIIAYSLGNFIFDQPFSKETMQGLTLEVILNPDEKIIKRFNTYTTEQNKFFQPQAPIKN